MKTLQQALDSFRDNGGAASTLRKHLSAAGIKEWGDINREALYDLRDTLTKNLAASTARTVILNFKAFVRRHLDYVNLPDDWAEILSVKNEALPSG